jgi:hypothetical protein
MLLAGESAEGAGAVRSVNLSGSARLTLISLREK